MISKYALVLLSDSKYLEYSKQVFYTATRFGNWKYDLVLLAYEIENEDAYNWFKERNISIIEVNAKMLNIDNITSDRKVYFAKLLLFHPILSHYKKIIYLDTDIIVRKSLSPLLKFNKFSAANDYFNNPILFQFSKYNTQYHESEINKLLPYQLLYNTKAFNTGVMVIQSKNNSLTLFNELIELTKKYGHLSEYYEQGIINLKFCKVRKKIPTVYNDYYAAEPKLSGDYIGLSDKNSVILHIIKPLKPWIKECHLHDEWFKNKELSNKAWDFKNECKKTSKISIILTEIKVFKNSYYKPRIPIKANVFFKYLMKFVDVFLKMSSIRLTNRNTKKTHHEELPPIY